MNLTNPVSFIHFGLTNIPIYNSTNPSIRYTERIHRMLQLAANIYDASRTNTIIASATSSLPIGLPPAFLRHQYGGTNRPIYIVGYTQVTSDAVRPDDARRHSWISPIRRISPTTDNVWGVPWVVGAVKGLPAFDRYVSGTSWMVTRKLLFKRQNPFLLNGTLLGSANLPPATDGTNQFFIMSVSNFCGMDAWNNYASNINYPFQVVASNYVTITLSNNSAQNPMDLILASPTHTWVA